MFLKSLQRRGCLILFLQPSGELTQGELYSAIKKEKEQTEAGDSTTTVFSGELHFYELVEDTKDGIWLVQVSRTFGAAVEYLISCNLRSFSDLDLFAGHSPESGGSAQSVQLGQDGAESFSVWDQDGNFQLFQRQQVGGETLCSAGVHLCRRCVLSLVLTA